MSWPLRPVSAWAERFVDDPEQRRPLETGIDVKSGELFEQPFTGEFPWLPIVHAIAGLAFLYVGIVALTGWWSLVFVVLGVGNIIKSAISV